MSISKIQPKTRYLLWAKSGGRCQFNGCNDPLWRDGLTQIEMNFADVAHIIGDRPKGPRGDPIRSKEYCNDITNLMLMCKKHHEMIDENVSIYSEEALREMKHNHEQRIETLTAITPDKTSYVVIYRGRVGKFQPKISTRDTWWAMYPERYPAEPNPLGLGMTNNSYEDKESDYWKIESNNLERQFSEKIRPYLNDKNEKNHFSIFAFAPQPLLIKLGSLIPDIYHSDVYQLHKEPTTWEWQPSPETFEYFIQKPSALYSTVAINLSLSAEINSERISNALNTQTYSEWKMTISRPHNDFLRGKTQLSLFRNEFRSLLNAIKSNHGENVAIHIFPAVPVAVAVEIGRVRQPKADLPFVVYDENKATNGFTYSLTIGDHKND